MIFVKKILSNKSTSNRNTRSEGITNPSLYMIIKQKHYVQNTTNLKPKIRPYIRSFCTNFYTSAKSRKIDNTYSIQQISMAYANMYDEYAVFYLLLFRTLNLHLQQMTR